MQTKIPTLRETVEDARSRKVAVGHFNISNLEGLWAIFHAAQKLNVPVIIGVSEGEREAVGVMQAAALVKSIREEFSYPIFLNADHTYSFEKVKAAIDAGFDSVICDGAALSYEENVAYASQCVAYAKEIKEGEEGRDVIIEGELGYIGQSSKLLDSLPEGVSTDEKYLTDPKVAKEFVEATGIDMLAPAVGNVHGMLKSGYEPPLNVPRVKEIADAVGIPMVLHGASGNTAADIQGAIKNGMGIVHVNTELRVAYTNALRKFLNENPDETTPYKVTAAATKAMQDVVEAKLRIFNNL